MASLVYERENCNADIQFTKEIEENGTTTVLFRTTLTQTITQYELLILLGSNHLLCYVHLDDRANDLRTTTSVR